MPRKSSLPALAAVPPGQADAQPLIGPRALIAGEDAAASDEFLARVQTAVAPDVVDLAWDVLRLRRLEAKLLAPQLAGDPEPGILMIHAGVSPGARTQRSAA